MLNPHFFYRKDGLLKKINVDEILFLEAASNYTYFSMIDRERIMIRITLQEALNLLPKYMLLRINRSHAVAAQYVAAVSRDEVFFVGLKDFTLHVSKQYYASLGKQVTILETSSSNRKEQEEEKNNTIM
jgi:DNA-binding LytR/AlgR family response regulator